MLSDPDVANGGSPALAEATPSANSAAAKATATRKRGGLLCGMSLLTVGRGHKSVDPSNEALSRVARLYDKRVDLSGRIRCRTRHLPVSHPHAVGRSERNSRALRPYRESGDVTLLWASVLSPDASIYKPST